MYDRRQTRVERGLFRSEYRDVYQYSREAALSWQQGSAFYVTVGAPCAQYDAEGRRVKSKEVYCLGFMQGCPP